jgi:iron complex outermembrane receptor protein
MDDGHGRRDRRMNRQLNTSMTPQRFPSSPGLEALARFACASPQCFLLPPAARTRSRARIARDHVNQGPAAPQADVSGFGDVPLRELPLSATVIDSKQLSASGARRLADLTQFDSSVTDAYNSAGYWDYLTVRGFVLDNRFNYRREGLPISAETSIPLDNKERVEILRGTSGIQAGTSAPGGLVNYVVKRPTEQDLRTVRIETASRGSVLGALDLGGRFGPDRQFGYRLNVASENLKPLTHNLDGNRNMFSLAADWRITRDSVLEFEVERSRKTQPSQNGYSLLGTCCPRRSIRAST